jgi:hypothetical protein
LCIEVLLKEVLLKELELKGKELYCILYKLLGRYFHGPKIDLCMETGPPAHNTINFFWVYIEMLPPPVITQHSPLLPHSL